MNLLTWTQHLWGAHSLFSVKQNQQITKTVAKAAEVIIILPQHLSSQRWFSGCFALNWIVSLMMRAEAICQPICRGLQEVRSLLLCTVYWNWDSYLAVLMSVIWCHQEDTWGIEWTKTVSCRFYVILWKGQKCEMMSDFSFRTSEGTVCMRLLPNCAWALIWVNRWLRALMTE